MEIKTLSNRLDHVEDFDERVNKALAEGWRLTRRDILHTEGPYLCYAEMIKARELTADPITWKDAVRILKETCEGASACSDECPMFWWCMKNLPDGKPAVPPNHWSDPDEEEVELK